MIDAPAASPPLAVRAAPGARRISPRAGLLACCLLLALLPLVTAPGDIIADSKLDLSVNPVRFLARALFLWDPQQFGQLQNQYNGYLFPMGPFFVLGKLVAVPPWILQRLWISAVLIAAFLGTVWLAKRLGIGTPWTRAAAGLAYALSPMALTLLGEYSGEYLPQAILPWILIPLTNADPVTGNDGRPAGGHFRAVAQSAVAVAVCSGINAACTVAALFPAVIYILTRSRTVRWRLLAWWAPAVVLATLWWSVPLVLLSRYGVSFLPYTESAAATTSVTSLDHALRGTENWISYLMVNGRPWWVVGYRIANQALPTLLGGLVAGLGLWGLTRRKMPERRFLLWSVLAGLAIISSGYLSSLGNPLAGPLADLINGPASAFRNLWKFDPLIRLPIVLGLAQLLATAHLPRLETRRPGLSRLAVTAAAGVGIGGLALPVYLSGLATAGSFGQIPSYWVSAADWLNVHAGHSEVLLVPGAEFGQYTWGSPLDDVVQPYTTLDWAERNLSFIGSAGNERLLDAIDQRLAAGAGSAGLTQVIARMGVKYLVVRNDIDRSILLGAWPARIHQALAASPGMTEVAAFGPLVSGIAPDDAATNFDAPYPAVEIYQVAGAQPVVALQPASGTLRVYGAPESEITLAEEGMLGTRPVLLNQDGAGLKAQASVATDSLRRKVRDFGELRTSYSPTLTATQPANTFEVTGDYLEPGWSRYFSVARYTGIKSVTASSSASDIATIPQLWASGLGPYAAVDGDLRTKWESGSWTGPIGQWIQLNFDSAVHPRTVKVTFVENSELGPPASQVVVETARGKLTEPVRNTPDPQSLRVPAGSSGWLRITVTRLAWPAEPSLGAEVAISDIVVPGTRASRTIVAPSVPGGDPSAVVLAKAQAQPSGCMLTSLRWVCSPSLATATEEQYGFDRSFTGPGPGPVRPVTLHGSAMLADPALADKYAAPGRGQPTVTASSIYTQDLADQPRSAFDGNPATSWIAGSQDMHPTLAIRWGRPRTIRRITIERPPGTPGLLQVLIAGANGQARGAMLSGAKSVVTFAPMRTTGLTLTFTGVQAPLQISDVLIPGVPSLTAPPVPFRLRCGLGPLIKLNGKVVPTQVSGTFDDLLNGRPMQFTACSPATLTAGVNHVVEPSSDAFSVQDVVLGGPGTMQSTGPSGPAVIKSWTPALRTVKVTAATQSYLVVNENFNVGWRAVIGGRPLRAVRLDGWKQAWLLPAGTSGVVTLTYQPDGLYRDAVFGGLVMLALIMLIAMWPLKWWPKRRRRVRESGPGSARLRLLMACVLLPATGFWLGGYPGAVIVPAATVVLVAAARRPEGPNRFWRGLSWPPALAVLVLATSVGAAAGHRLLLAGDSGLVVTALGNALPQVLGLLIVAGLAAALLTGDAMSNRAVPAGGVPAGGVPAGGVPAGRELADIGRAWETLAEDDPLWAICVAPEAKHWGWDVAKFYATGTAEVEAVLSRAEQLGLRASGERALDFGCGVGRLTRALAARFELAVGVDIAPGMLDLAQRDNPVASRCRFLLNSRPDLALLEDGEFDLVYTSVVLQHLTPDLIRAYLAEFARVLRPGGSLVFQLPTHPRWTPRGLLHRCLPSAVLGLIQRKLLGYPAPMQMHGLAERRVRALLASHGVEILAADPTTYDPNWHELRYFCRQREFPDDATASH